MTGVPDMSCEKCGEKIPSGYRLTFNGFNIKINLVDDMKPKLNPSLVILCDACAVRCAYLIAEWLIL